MKKFFALVPAIALLASCASMKADRKLLADASVREAMPPFELNLGFDIFMLRVDLRRGTHETFEFDDGGEAQTVEVENNYHPLVVDLGGGLILDYNNNLCLDLLRLYGLSSRDRFTVTVTGSLADGVPALVKKDGASYRIERKYGAPRLETGTSTAVSAADDKNQLTVSLEKDKVSAETRYRDIKTGSSYIARRQKDHAVVRTLFGEEDLAYLEGNTVRTIDRHKIEHLKDRLEFDGNTLISAGGSLYVFDRWYHGFELRREGNTVQHFVNGKLFRTYRVSDID
jgi:hypothetical protein